MTERTTADLLLEWDRTRPRSQQAELGWSEVGGCRRRAGYRLAGTPPTNPGGSVQAVLGTAIHDAVQQRLAETAGPDDLVEHEVTFAGILGHIDRYEADTASVVDVKTTSSRWLEHIKVHGPDRSHLWQINGYAAALIKGRPVRRLVLDYIARDTGELHRWTGRPDPLQVKAALEWLRAVRAVPVEMLNRDYDPDGPWCRHCPFFDTCWSGGVPDRNKRSVMLVEQPGDAPRWLTSLLDTREQISDLKDAEGEAKNVLDGLRPNDFGQSDVVDVGHPEFGLQWTITTSERLDTAVVKAEYAATGQSPPTKTSTSTRLAIVPLPEETS